tara:strand:+ start:390 stop:545 length:156 start_codon:yes stop_codon:yes gene_type:complete
VNLKLFLFLTLFGKIILAADVFWFRKKGGLIEQIGNGSSSQLSKTFVISKE